MKSFALDNIKKYQRSQQIELLKTIGYHFAEFLTIISIFALGIAIMTIL